MKKNKTITRSLSAEKLNVRADEESGKRYLEGYAIVFNQRSKLIREWGETFFEVIEPTAPDNVLADEGLNVIATVDHSRAKMLGRNISGTLELVKDDHGLKYIIEVPDTTLGNDTYQMVKRGDYFESSFIFTIAEKGVRTDTAEDIPVRYISDFENIYDVSIVIDGAYANTIAAARAQEYDKQNTPTPDPAIATEQARQLDILSKELIIETLK